MKFIKTVFLSLLLSVTALSLSGCIRIPRTYNHGIDPTTVDSIEIYDLTEIEFKRSNEFLGKIQPAYTVPEDQMDDFLNQFLNVDFSDDIIITIAAVDRGFYYGNYVVRINNTDGSFRLISDCNYGEAFNANGEKVDTNNASCDKEEWNAFITKFLKTE